jgi:hypothetical protein
MRELQSPDLHSDECGERDGFDETGNRSESRIRHASAGIKGERIFMYRNLCIAQNLMSCQMTRPDDRLHNQRFATFRAKCVARASRALALLMDWNSHG